MRKTFVAAAVATILSAGAFLTSANALTLTAPAGIRAATEGVTQAEQVRYVCYRVKRHGVWRKHCEWRPNRTVYYGGGYSPYYYQPYAYRPYYGGYPYYGYGYRSPGVGLHFRF